VALTIGILFGIYSSVFVAAAIAMWLGVKREDLVKTGTRKSIRTIRTPGRWCRVQTTSHPRALTPDPWRPPPIRWHCRTGEAKLRRGAAQWPASVVQAVDSGARILLSQVADPPTMMRRRDAVEDLQKFQSVWLQGTVSALRSALQGAGMSAVRPADLPAAGSRGGIGATGGLSLVDNDTIESEILSSRLALAMMDRASWEFTDMRSRMTMLEARDELDTNDVLRPHVLARIVANAWRTAGLSHEAWKTLQTVLHDEFAHFAEEAYHEINRWLIHQRVLPRSICGPSSGARAARPGPEARRVQHRLVRALRVTTPSEPAAVCTTKPA
jgi:hypothetical protein